MMFKEIYLAEEYKYELKVDSMWAMVNKKYSYNKLHTHPGVTVEYIMCSVLQNVVTLCLDF